MSEHDASLNLRVDGAQFVLRLDWLERLEAWRSKVVADSSSITSIEQVDDALANVHGLRLVGTSLPGSTAVGRFVAKGLRTFAVVHRGRPGGIVISFSRGDFDQWVIGSADPAREIARLRTELAASQ